VDHAIESQTDILDAAAKAASAIVQAILMNMPTGIHLARGAQAAELESFDGSRDKAEQVFLPVHIAIMMQLNTFTEKGMKNPVLPLLHAWRNSASLG